MLLKGEADKKRHAMAHKLLGEMRANKRPPAKKREIAGGDEEQESLERVIPLDARPKASAGECPPTTRPKKKARAAGADGEGATRRRFDRRPRAAVVMADPVLASAGDGRIGGRRLPTSQRGDYPADVRKNDRIL